MSYIGAQNLGNIPPNTFERDTVAATTNLQVTLNILPGDSIERNFTEINKDEVWKYKSGSSRPTLAPIHQLRVSTPGSEQNQDNLSWKANYNALVKQLPPDVQNFLAEQQALPFEERLDSFIALENTLVMNAKFLTWQEVGSSPEQPETPKAQQTALNLRMPEIVNEGLNNSGSLALSETRSTLESIGPNHPDFDFVHLSLSKAEEALTHLNKESSHD